MRINYWKSIVYAHFIFANSSFRFEKQYTTNFFPQISQIFPQIFAAKESKRKSAKSAGKK
jgi:hypothetical protein